MKTVNTTASNTKDSFAVIYNLVKGHRVTRNVRMVKPSRGRRCFKATLADKSSLYVSDFFGHGTLRVVKSKEDKNGNQVLSTCADLYLMQIATLLNGVFGKRAKARS